jgi:hypothetical protein
MQQKLLARIRFMIGVFVVLLILSGITAFPVYTELKMLIETGWLDKYSLLGGWLYKVWYAIEDTNAKHDFLFYGYDWLAFAHIVIGTAFIGPYRDPVRNKWIIDWGMIACVGVLPLAFIMGPIRGIPLFHILIDCSFGVLGIIPLLIVKKWIEKLEKLST